MKKIFIILRHEFLGIVTKPSFWFGLLVVPIITGVVFGVIAISSGLATFAAAERRRNEIPQPQGYVDQASVINPTYLQQRTPLQPFATEAEAQAALQANTISGYYLVPANFIEIGDITFISTQFSPFENASKSDDFRQALRLSLLNGDAELLKRIDEPIDLGKRESLAPQEQRRGVFGDFSPLPFAVCLLFFMVLITASSYLMQTVTTEKENRVMEVLMSSASPVQLLTGKVLGLGLLGLIQLVLWLGSALSVANNPVVASYIGIIQTSTVVWSVIYFVLGYLIYACLMAGLGALMPGAKEANQYVFFVLLPLLIPLYLNSAITQRPDGTLATALSLFPFTSPVVMPMRLVSSNVPALHLLVGLLFLVIAVLVVIWLSARIFRAQSLLAGSKPSLRQLVVAIQD
jgi:ABC-2 type transport system permease protein